MYSSASILRCTPQLHLPIYLQQKGAHRATKRRRIDNRTSAVTSTFLSRPYVIRKKQFTVRARTLPEESTSPAIAAPRRKTCYASRRIYVCAKWYSRCDWWVAHTVAFSHANHATVVLSRHFTRNVIKCMRKILRTRRNDKSRSLRASKKEHCADQ